MYPIPIPEYPGYYIDYHCNVWDKNYNKIKPEWCYYYKHRFLGYIMDVNGKKTVVHAWTIKNIHYYLCEIRPTDEELEGYEEMMNEMNARGEFDK